MFFATFSPLRPDPAPLTSLDTSVLDDAFRVAVCLGATDRAATVIAALAVRGMRMRGRGEAAPERRIRVLGRVIAEARIALASAATRREPPLIPPLAALRESEREVMVLDLACALSEEEIARVVGLQAPHVRALRCAARLSLVSRE